MAMGSDANGSLSATLFAFAGTVGAAVAAGFALSRVRVTGADPVAVSRTEPESTSAAGESEGSKPSRPVADFEYCARVIWTDGVNVSFSDLEDTEAVEAMVRAGWELVDVIVPFAETRQIRMSYPGNTRKLIGYFRRERAIGGEEPS